MTEIVMLARGVLLCSALQFALGVWGPEKLFGIWQIDRKTVIITALLLAFGGVMLLAAGGAA